MTRAFLNRHKASAALLLVLLILVMVYLPTFQTIVNGSSDDLMNDVGEIQNVLNTGGTLHATGYPLFTMLGSLFVAIVRGVGMAPVIAPAAFSLVCGLIGLACIFALARHLTGRIELAAIATLLYGLTYYTWLYSVVANVRTMGLMIEVLLLIVALWQPPVPRRLDGNTDQRPNVIAGSAVARPATWAEVPTSDALRPCNLRPHPPLPLRRGGLGRGETASSRSFDSGQHATPLRTLLAMTTGSRLYWLALLGGIGIAHHRAFIFFVPAILYAVWQELVAEIRKRPLQLVSLLGVGLLGFLPYAYLPWRANAGGAWVYGEPNTWQGFWDQFAGREAAGLFGLNTSPDLIRQLFDEHLVLITKQVTWPGILLGLLGLALAAYRRKYRHPALVLILISLGPFAFDMVGTLDHLPPFIMTFALSLVFGWVFLLDALLDSTRFRRYTRVALLPLTLVAALALVVLNFSPIHDLTNDPTASETIQFAESVPAGATLMLDWGARYFAVGFAQDVLGQLPHIYRVDHRGDLAAIAKKGPLVTPDFTFYYHPLSWWREKLSARVYLRAAGPQMVQVDIAPRTASSQMLPATFDTSSPVIATSQAVECTRDRVILQVDWLAVSKPPRNLSVFVHLLNAEGAVIATADQSAPVYGWYPLTLWGANEIVHDIYPIPRVANAESIEYGLYERLPSGEFKNYNGVRVPVECVGARVK